MRDDIFLLSLIDLFRIGYMIDMGHSKQPDRTALTQTSAGYNFRCLPLLSSIRLPKWLYNPPVLTSLAFLPAMDLGNLCRAGGGGRGADGLEGVCRPLGTCSGPGLVPGGAGCTVAKSVCCAELSPCDSSLQSPVSYLLSPGHPVPVCRARLGVEGTTGFVR